MAIQMKCICGAKYSLQTSLAGKTAKCHACGRKLRIPSLLESDAYDALKDLPICTSPEAEDVLQALRHRAAREAEDGRYTVPDPLYPPNALALMRAQDLAAELAEQGRFRRDADGRRVFCFYDRTPEAAVPVSLDETVELSFPAGAVVCDTDPADAWNFYRLKKNVFLAVARGAAAKAAGGV